MQSGVTLNLCVCVSVASEERDGSVQRTASSSEIRRSETVRHKAQAWPRCMPFRRLRRRHRQHRRRYQFHRSQCRWTLRQQRRRIIHQPRVLQGPLISPLLLVNSRSLLVLKIFFLQHSRFLAMRLLHAFNNACSKTSPSSVGKRIPDSQLCSYCIHLRQPNWCFFRLSSPFSLDYLRFQPIKTFRVNQIALI